MTESLSRASRGITLVTKLLIVDDEELQRQALRRMTEEYRLDSLQVIGEASDGRRAADLAVELGADLVLMDIEMPQANGLQAIEEIRRRRPAIKIIVITAYDYFEYAQQALKLGAMDFLLKPVRPETLESALAQVCAQVELERQQVAQEKNLVFELLTFAARSAVAGGADGDAVQAISLRLLNQLSAATTLGELREIAVGGTDEFARQVSERKATPQWQLLKQALAYVQANYREGLTQEQVAQAVHLSPGYFSRLFRQEQGVTFSEYLATLRLQKAQHLLKTSSLSIGEIAAEVGYGDANYFSRVFSKTYGVSPSEFRESAKSRNRS